VYYKESESEHSDNLDHVIAILFSWNTFINRYTNTRSNRDGRETRKRGRETGYAYTRADMRGDAQDGKGQHRQPKRQAETARSKKEKLEAVGEGPERRRGGKERGKGSEPGDGAKDMGGGEAPGILADDHTGVNVERALVDDVMGSLELGVVTLTPCIIGWYESEVIRSEKPMAKDDLDKAGMGSA
jgi:hypothetical protein